MDIIYEPNGKAKEYAELALDLYQGCDHACTYCPSLKELGKNKREFHSQNAPIENVLAKLEKDAKHLNETLDKREILLGYGTDPYQTIESGNDSMITRHAIEILKKNNLNFSILTKGGLRIVRDFDLLKDYDNVSFGSSICFTNQDDSDKCEPNAPDLHHRIKAIREAHERGIKTWINLDPVIDQDQALKIIKKLHPYVNHWKVGKLDNGKSNDVWLKFRDEVTALLDSVGANYYLKRSLTDLWTEGVIPTRKGNRNILVIAPHGHPKDDTGTYRLARQLSDELDCYAVVNEKYRKPENVKSDEKYEKKYLVDLNLWPEIENSKEAMTDFIDPIMEFKDQNLQRFDSLFIVHIHGIGNDNRKRVAKLLPKFKDNPEDLHLLIGYGQHRTDNDRKTADLNNYVGPLCDLFRKQGLNAAIAPTDAIKDKNGEDQWYCGNHLNRLNQRLCKPKDKIQSLQLEFKKSGIRKNEPQAFNTAKLLGEALSELISETWNDIAGKSQVNAETNNQTLPAESQPLFDSGNEKIKIDDTQLNGGRPRQVEIRKITELRPHPLNREIYGDPNPDDGLKISIQKNGILTPLIVSGNGTIVSGHRRFSGAKECGIEEVPVIIMPPCDDLDIEETLIVANTQRQKTKEQIAREYEKLKVIEGEKSKIRMSLAGGDRKSEKYKKSPAQNSAEPISKGESRKLASAKLGVSHNTAEKSLKVVKSADELKAEGKTEDAQKLLDTLNNKSVNSAYKKVKAILEGPGKAGSIVNEKQSPANKILNRPKTPPPDKSRQFECDFNFEDIPQKDDIEKLEFDQLKQLESEIALQMEHIHEQMKLLKKQLDILGDCAETIGDVIHDKSNDTDIALPLESNGTINFSPIKSNDTDINARYRTNEREVPPGIELIPLPGYYRDNPAAAEDNDEM